MPLRIGDEAFDFTAETTERTINFHESIAASRVIIFYHPKGFTPVCITESGCMTGSKPEFDKRILPLKHQMTVQRVLITRVPISNVLESLFHAGYHLPFRYFLS